MDTKVTYHADGYGPARPAINVKCHASGLDFWPPEFHALPEAADRCQEIERTTAGDLVDAAYNITVSGFWQAAEEIATQRGLGEIWQGGRSGGWLMFDADPTHGGEDAPDTEWLAGYRALSEWADAYIAAAPARVAALAQSLAMDALGRAAAHRMFGTERMVTA